MGKGFVWTPEEDTNLMRDYLGRMKFEDLQARYGVSVSSRITKLRNEGHDLPRRLLRGKYAIPMSAFLSPESELPVARTDSERKLLEIRQWPLRYTHTGERRRHPDMKTACIKCGRYFATTLLQTKHTDYDCSLAPVWFAEQYGLSRRRIAEGWERGHWESPNAPTEEQAVATDEPEESLHRTITAEEIVKAFEERIKGIDEILAEKDKELHRLQTVISELNAQLADTYKKHQAEIDNVKAQREQIDARADGLITRLFNR